MKTVFVIGAGPAGLFAAQKIAQAGHQVVVFNRDIKPGGLAEYGIYPTKDKMKTGLRKQFAKVLSLPNLHYFGHVPVGQNSPLKIEDLKKFHPSAMVFAVGAQGTKKLGLEGSDAKGVYSAKDFVYYYNLLPPYATQDFSTGKRVAVIGMGNVAIDIVRWFLVDAPQKAEEVIVVARRGPFEAKFDEKEFKDVEEFFDREAFAKELERIAPQLAAVNQDPAKLGDETFPVLKHPAPEVKPKSRLLFRFLSSPTKIHAGANGRIERLTVTENVLTEKDGSIGCKGTERTADIAVDTMIFAIGDVADPALGLPYKGSEYVTGAHLGKIDAALYEVHDEKRAAALGGVFVVGWARKASEGLVGIARHDGEVGAAHVLQYLESQPDGTAVDPAAIKRSVEAKGIRIVDKADLQILEKAEQEEATRRADTRFKFSDDAKMLEAIEQRKESAAMV